MLARAEAAGVHAVSEAELLALPDRAFVAAIWATTRPVPVDAEFPLFFIYTSGSTGKPKGVVHVHGGWVVGIAHTMRVSFDAHPGDVIYVIADPGWITGQSYMISAALTTRVTTVIAEGAPVFPSAGRFASIIERYGVTIFKAGVTFLKTVMQDAQHELDVRQYDLSSVRVATFCAEPVSPAVQQFGMDPDRAPVYQLVLGHRAWRDCLDALLREPGLSAAGGRPHVSTAVGDRRRVGR